MSCVVAGVLMQTDTFVLQGPDVGDIERIRVRSSGTGLGAAWHLDCMDILSSATGQQYNFPFKAGLGMCVSIPLLLEQKMVIL